MPLELTKADARRALVAYQLAEDDLEGTFRRLRSVQFDPLQPAGCNHDLVLHARVPGYRTGDWQPAAYHERAIYDGWDKQASLVAMDGWPLRRVIHHWQGGWASEMEREFPQAMEAVLRELELRGPLQPKEFEFQERRKEWHGSWHGPSVTKRALRALWHAGKVMTTARRGNQHVYDLTCRVVPPGLLARPKLDVESGTRGVILERHRSAGLIRPTAPFEVWALQPGRIGKNRHIQELVRRSELVAVSIEGVICHCEPAFLEWLDAPAPAPSVKFIAPLDSLMWDRKLVAHLFSFEYLWEVYVPEAKRRWGYYVLPVLFGDQFVARFEPVCRDGALTVRSWQWELGSVAQAFWPALERAAAAFLAYAGVEEVTFGDLVPADVRRTFAKAIRS